MAKVVLRQEAIDDLNDIWFYTFEEWSEKQADKYYATLKFACTQIGNRAGGVLLPSFCARLKCNPE